MSLIPIPEDFYDVPEGNDFDTFPGTELKGRAAYTGTIEEPSNDPIRHLEDWNPPRKRLSIQLGNNRPIDDAPDPGARKYWPDIDLEVGGYDFGSAKNAPENIQRNLFGSLRRLVQLATAVGFQDEGADSFDADTFVSELTAGTFNGFDVTYEIYHRKYKDKKGNDQIGVNLAGFLPAT